jgi:hypothetical protein
MEPSTSSPLSDTQSSCPVPAEYRNPAIYNVYGQRIDGNQNCPSANPLAALQGTDLLDPKNNMPLEPNQQPCPGQRVPLSTDRLQSNIPKGGTDTTWLYPSPQMFFNGEQQPALLLRNQEYLFGRIQHWRRSSRCSQLHWQGHRCWCVAGVLLPK